MLGPNAPWRAAVVVYGRGGVAAAKAAHDAPKRKRRKGKEKEDGNAAAILVDGGARRDEVPEEGDVPRSIPGRTSLGSGVVQVVGARIDWARLLRRVYLENVLACPCGGRRRVIADLHDPEVVTAILVHLGLPAPAGPGTRAASAEAAIAPAQTVQAPARAGLSAPVAAEVEAPERARLGPRWAKPTARGSEPQAEPIEIVELIPERSSVPGKSLGLVAGAAERTADTSTVSRASRDTGNWVLLWCAPARYQPAAFGASASITAGGSGAPAGACTERRRGEVRAKRRSYRVTEDSSMRYPTAPWNGPARAPTAQWLGRPGLRLQLDGEAPRGTPSSSSAPS
ncbi:uncharacterized protein SOCE836_039390 [Sorangium cellulosum]|uniref:Uncharacterized protein n=1 Tax=Sorangium cellulosum TaxID=56 RepID=A0A4P2QPC5_SORCE|nr:uncharacterized protein SOCE836_039390 [Sorangium cellulosum]WCQ91182.1 hypothetical protein NQZ70_03897 [Sorangium sp. Soce836]